MKKIQKNICKGLAFLTLALVLSVPFVNKNNIPTTQNANSIISLGNFNPTSFIIRPFGF